MKLFGSTSVRLSAETEKTDRIALELEREREKARALMIPTGFTWPDARVHQDATPPTWWPGLRQDSVLPRDGWDTKPPRSRWDRTQIALNVVIVAGVTAYVVGTIVAQAQR